MKPDLWPETEEEPEPMSIEEFVLEQQQGVEDII